MATANPNPTRIASPDKIWSMTVGSGGGGNGDYVCCPPGNYAGTIVGIFDVGTQNEQVKDAGVKPIHRLVVVFELAKKRPDGRPFILAKKYTWSMRDNSHLYRDVISITGHAFRDGEQFNPTSINGLPVSISVSNTQSGDKCYHDVSSVAQMLEGSTPPQPTHRPVSWSVLSGDPFPAGLDWLPYVYGKSVQDLANASVEAKARNGQLPDFGLAPATSPLNPPAHKEDPDNPLPF